MPVNVVLDGAAIGVIATAVTSVTAAAFRLAQTRGQYRAKAADEYATANTRASEYATALRAIADLLEDDGSPPPAELCARVSILARNALGLHGDYLRSDTPPRGIHRQHRRKAPDPQEDS